MSSFGGPSCLPNFWLPHASPAGRAEMGFRTQKKPNPASLCTGATPHGPSSPAAPCSLFCSGAIMICKFPL